MVTHSNEIPKTNRNIKFISNLIELYSTLSFWLLFFES